MRRGVIYVVFGKAEGLGNIDLANLRAEDGFIIDGTSTRDYAGRSVSSAGDVNGDGFDDVIVTERENAVVVFGGADSSPVRDASFPGSGTGFVMSHDALISSVSSAGDIQRRRL